ncbi:anti-sigma factor [Pseudonocardia xinjiangensis]|uniref:anti-sigma factor n=1 Tax=Pseudonocardia xinjiangensis TaxID=75289 RepID=UPI003D8BE459
MWHPDPDALTLAALPAEPPDPQVDAHLTTCALCREEVAALRDTVAMAQAGDAAMPPPARVWQAVLDELGDTAAPSPSGPDRGIGGRSGAARPRWRRWALPVATAAAGLVAGVVLGVGFAGAPRPAMLAQVPLAPLAAADPAASGSADVLESGGMRQVEVTVDDPGGIRPGAYLEAWLMDAAGTRLYSLGALAPEVDGSRFRGTFALPADLTLDQFGVVDVSAESLDGDPSHSGTSLLRGHTT